VPALALPFFALSPPLNFPKKSPGWLRALVVVTGLGAGSAAFAVDYSRDIKPILSENCFSCHGFDEKSRKGKLRLDVVESAYAERNGLCRIKPGDLAHSEVLARITSTAPEEVMPPPKDHALLTAAQKQKIETWMEEGAKYSEHWSFVPPRKAALPPKGTHPVDAFFRAPLAPPSARDECTGARASGACRRVSTTGPTRRSGRRRPRPDIFAG